MDPDKILITGITSIHGWPIFLAFRKEYGDRVYGVSPENMREYFNDEKRIFFCNMEDFSGIKDIFEEVDPGSVIHAGGVCDLDRCESSPYFAYEINVLGTRNLVSLCGGRYFQFRSHQNRNRIL